MTEPASRIASACDRDASFPPLAQTASAVEQSGAGLSFTDREARLTPSGEAPAGSYQRLAGAALAFSMLATAAAAEPCGLREPLVAGLASKLIHEAPVGVGMTAEGAWVELWVNEDTGTFSLLRSTPDGRSCLIASGGDWWAQAPGAPT